MSTTTAHRDPAIVRAVDAARERFTSADGREGPDAESLSLHVAAELILTREGKDPETCETGDYMRALRVAQGELGLSVQAAQHDGPDAATAVKLARSRAIDATARAILKEQGKTFAQATQAEYLAACQAAEAQLAEAVA